MKNSQVIQNNIDLVRRTSSRENENILLDLNSLFFISYLINLAVFFY